LGCDQQPGWQRPPKHSLLASMFLSGWLNVRGLAVLHMGSMTSAGCHTSEAWLCAPVLVLGPTNAHRKRELHASFVLLAASWLASLTCPGPKHNTTRSAIFLPCMRRHTHLPPSHNRISFFELLASTSPEPSPSFTGSYTSKASECLAK